MEKETQEELRNLRNAVRFLAEAVQGLAEQVTPTDTRWAGDAIDKVEQKLTP